MLCKKRKSLSRPLMSAWVKHGVNNEITANSIHAWGLTVSILMPICSFQPWQLLFILRAETCSKTSHGHDRWAGGCFPHSVSTIHRITHLNLAWLDNFTCTLVVQFGHGVVFENHGACPSLETAIARGRHTTPSRLLFVGLLSLHHICHDSLLVCKGTHRWWLIDRSSV